MASSILRTLSAWRSSREARFSLLSLVTPSTQRATSSPKFLRISSSVARGVLHHVVQQPGFEARHVHVHVGELARHQQRMDHVGLARGALLALVALGGEAEGLVERRQILVGAQLADAGFQLVDRADSTGIRRRTVRLGGSRPSGRIGQALILPVYRAA